MKRIFKTLGEIVVLILFVLGAWFMGCVSTYQVCSSDMKSICSFYCDSKEIVGENDDF